MGVDFGLLLDRLGMVFIFRGDLCLGGLQTIFRMLEASMRGPTVLIFGKEDPASFERNLGHCLLRQAPQK